MSLTLRGFAVHLLTASGAAWALLALLAASRGAFAAMFWWLSLALLVDALDGPLARRVRVDVVLPRWSGDILDLIVDFLTYVFVPAYALAVGGLAEGLAGDLLAVVIVVTGALYFADRQMKLAGNYFRGFPAVWNVAVFYLFVLKPAPWVTGAVVLALAVATFLPFKFVHPVRVTRLRKVNFLMLALWALLGAWALLQDLAPAAWVGMALLAIAVYFVAVGLTDRSEA